MEQTNKQIWESYWTDKNIKDEFSFQKRDGTVLKIKKGSWLKLPNRNDMVMVDLIIKSREEQQKDIGPMGFTYLPWRYEERRFASIMFSFKGNTRFVVCYPVGRNHYGINLDWDEVDVYDQPPDNIDTSLVMEIMHKKYYEEEEEEKEEEEYLSNYTRVQKLM